jgi:hypothetical protein
MIVVPNYVAEIQAAAPFILFALFVAAFVLVCEHFHIGY